MKRSWLRRKTGFKQKLGKPMKRTRIARGRAKLRVKGHSTTTELKDEIQALLRELAIKIYGTCVLSKYPETGACGSYTIAGNLILQAEHLNSRSHTGTFGDMRNIILLCQRHHIYWKPQNSQRYWELIREIIGEERWTWYQRCKEDRTAYKVDLKLILLDLKHQLKQYD